MARAIAKGVIASGHEADVVKAREISAKELQDYDAFILGTPTHVGGPTFSIGRAIKYIGKNGGEGKPFTTFTTWINLDQKTLLKLDQSARKAGLERLMDGRSYKVRALKGPLDDGSIEDAEVFGQEIMKALGA